MRRANSKRQRETVHTYIYSQAIKLHDKDDDGSTGQTQFRKLKKKNKSAKPNLKNKIKI